MSTWRLAMWFHVLPWSWNTRLQEKTKKYLNFIGVILDPVLQAHYILKILSSPKKCFASTIMLINYQWPIIHYFCNLIFVWGVYFKKPTSYLYQNIGSKLFFLNKYWFLWVYPGWSTEKFLFSKNTGKVDYILIINFNSSKIMKFSIGSFNCGLLDNFCIIDLSQGNNVFVSLCKGYGFRRILYFGFG